MSDGSKGTGPGPLTPGEAARLRKQLGGMRDVEAAKHFRITITSLARAAAELAVQQGTLALVRAGMATL